MVKICVKNDIEIETITPRVILKIDIKNSEKYTLCDK